MIRIEHLRKEYELDTPIKDLSVEINKGDIIAVIGPSGTGKSTLLRLLNLMEEPTAGDIYLDEERITAPDFDKKLARQKIGMVFQNFSLFEHLNVIENIMIAPVMILGMSKQEAYDKGMELLDLVELSDRSLSYPSELSGGQKQRVAIARAIAMEPKILLLDEPTSALDPRMKQEVVRILIKLASMGTTMMIVTHEMELARSIGNRVLYLDKGGVEEDGPASEFFELPKSPLAKAFLFREHKLAREILPVQYSYQQFLVELTEFFLEHMLPSKLSYKMICTLEELIVNCIFPKVSQDNKINVEILHSDRENSAVISYCGENFDPLPDEDSLERKIILGMSDNYHYENKGENVITLSFS